jgi:hypothetical protein
MKKVNIFFISIVFFIFNLYSDHTENNIQDEVMKNIKEQNNGFLEDFFTKQTFRWNYFFFLQEITAEGAFKKLQEINDDNTQLKQYDSKRKKDAREEVREKLITFLTRDTTIFNPYYKAGFYQIVGATFHKGFKFKSNFDNFLKNNKIVDYDSLKKHVDKNSCGDQFALSIGNVLTAVNTYVHAMNTNNEISKQKIGKIYENSKFKVYNNNKKRIVFQFICATWGLKNYFRIEKIQDLCEFFFVRKETGPSEETGRLSFEQVNLLSIAKRIKDKQQQAPILKKEQLNDNNFNKEGQGLSQYQKEAMIFDRVQKAHNENNNNPNNEKYDPNNDEHISIIKKYMLKNPEKSQQNILELENGFNQEQQESQFVQIQKEEEQNKQQPDGACLQKIEKIHKLDDSEDGKINNINIKCKKENKLASKEASQLLQIQNQVEQNNNFKKSEENNIIGLLNDFKKKQQQNIDFYRNNKDYEIGSRQIKRIKQQ